MRSIETERLISFHDQKLWIDSNWCLKIERIPNGFVSIESNSKVVCTKTNNSIWSANGKLSTASSENNIQQQQKEEKSKLYNTTAIKPRKNHGNNTKASEYNNSRAVFVEGNLFCFSARTHFVCMPPVSTEWWKFRNSTPTEKECTKCGKWSRFSYPTELAVLCYAISHTSEWESSTSSRTRQIVFRIPNESQHWHQTHELLLACWLSGYPVAIDERRAGKKRIRNRYKGNSSFADDWQSHWSVNKVRSF